MNSARIEIHGTEARLDPSGRWRHPNAGIEESLNAEFSPLEMSPAHGDPFAAAASLAAAQFGGKVVSVATGETPPADVVH